MSDFVKEKTEQGFTMELSLDPHTFEGFVDVGFTRGFASSQAFRDKFPKDADIDEIGKTIIPSTKESGLAFHKLAPNTFAEMPRHPA